MNSDLPKSLSFQRISKISNDVLNNSFNQKSISLNCDPKLSPLKAHEKSIMSLIELKNGKIATCSPKYPMAT